MSSYTRQQLEAWIKDISIQGGRVLDIGGSQKPLYGRLAKFEPKRYDILDLEVPHILEKEPELVGDIQEICGNDFDKTNYYDKVFCIEVSEYWYNPLQALININSFLKQGGLLYISFHFIYPIHNPTNSDYLRYTPEGCYKLLTEAGFEAVSSTVRIAEHAGYLKDWFTLEKMRPAKNTPHDYVGMMISAKKL